MKAGRATLYVMAFLGVTAAALAFRLPQLGVRPMHGDEANQAVKAGMLFDRGIYRYDPHEHHGPTLYYLTLPLLWLSGAASFAETTEVPYRLVPLLAGVGLLGLLWVLRTGLGRHAALWAGGFTAVSHAMVYYSRYYVQEMLLVFFAFGAIVAGWRYWRSRKLGWAITTGVFLGLVHATKETCVLVFAAMAGALVLTVLWARWRDGARVGARQWPHPAHLAAGMTAALAVSVLLYTSFFTHWRGPLDSVLAYATYLGRSEGTGSVSIHDKPWHYYLHILLYTYRTAGPRWTEGLIVGLGAVGIVVTLFRRGATGRETSAGIKEKAVQETHSEITDSPTPDPHLLRFLAFYALLLTATYSAIPYKTPWNLLIFVQPLILLAGVGAAALIRAGRFWPLKALICALLVVGTLHAARQTRLGVFLYGADPRNPYVYAHTSTNLLRLVRRVGDIAAVHPDGKAMQINIFRLDGDYWPLPWYLRAYPHVGYWTALPKPPDAPMIIASPELQTVLSKSLREPYQIEYYSLRPGVLLHAYTRLDLWDRFMASRRL